MKNCSYRKKEMKGQRMQDKEKKFMSLLSDEKTSAA